MRIAGLTLLAKVGGLVRSRAAGAAIAQIWQAAGGFGLQLAAAWTLGAAGLGLVSLCLGVIVMATAVTSGMVGDSLVVLDRSDRRIRGALQAWALILACLGGLAAGVGMALSRLTTGQAVLFALALVIFQAAELVRRLLMANLLFWRLVVQDSVAVGATLAVVATWHALAGLSLGAFFVAMTVGQSLGVVVGMALVPASDRRWVSMRGANLRRVGGYGAWRGAQVGVPPALLTAARVLITLFTGAVALGLVEAARILAAPLLLVVQGLGSYLFSSYARDAHLGARVLRARAWRASGAMVASVLVLGAVLVALTPVLGPLITASGFEIARVTVAGWVLYVAASASLQPFASLAAVLGQQRRVFGCRLIDALFAAALLALLLGVGVSAAWAPYALACGLALGGVLVRRLVLAPLIRSPHSTDGGPQQDGRTLPEDIVRTEQR